MTGMEFVDGNRRQVGKNCGINNLASLKKQMDVNIYFEDPMEWAKRVTTEFAKNHPYPSFGEVRAMLPLNLQLDYCEFDHAYCSEMYQNGFSDRELNQVCGKAIGMRGEFRAMQTSYYESHRVQVYISI